MTASAEKIADKYISKSGRTAKYGREAMVDDVVDAGSFLVWAEDDGAMYGGVEAKDALRAVCRLLDLDPRGLRRAIMGPHG